MEKGSLEKIDGVISMCEPTFEKGLNEKLEKREIAEVLAIQLFEISKELNQKLVEVRDYETIKEKGTFRYSGQIDTLHAEGILPDDLYDEFQKLNLDRHVGPSYLRVKGLLTHDTIRTFFGKQLAYLIRDNLKENPPHKEGVVLFLPNMTGGVWIGDETRRQATNMLEQKVWPTTPYARETRKLIDTIPKESIIVDYIEGLLPSPGETSVVIDLEELRTTAETTKNAIKILKSFGYNKENEVELKGACVFDYRHVGGVERLKRLGIDDLYLVDGMTFLDVSKEMGYIKDSQHKTATDWLKSPWDYTREILPMMKGLLKK